MAEMKPIPRLAIGLVGLAIGFVGGWEDGPALWIGGGLLVSAGVMGIAGDFGPRASGHAWWGGVPFIGAGAILQNGGLLLIGVTMVVALWIPRYFPSLWRVTDSNDPEPR